MIKVYSPSAPNGDPIAETEGMLDLSFSDGTRVTIIERQRRGCFEIQVGTPAVIEIERRACSAIYITRRESW